MNGVIYSPFEIHAYSFTHECKYTDSLEETSKTAITMKIDLQQNTATITCKCININGKKYHSQ